jgi:hypothetical protein
VVVVVQDVVDVGQGRRAHRLSLSCKEIEDLRLALIGTAPLAVAADAPEHIVEELLVNPLCVAPLESLETLAYEG